ncbi:MAG: hypothetical protein RBS49_09730, partial [Sphaerochaeta sp.]|nr:hypothetical protein [Sphaerochaeta sp.]
MAKVTFSNDIEEAVRARFDEICAHLTATNYVVLERMILAFGSMPDWFQDALVSKRPGVADAAMELLAGLKPSALGADGKATGRD